MPHIRIEYSSSLKPLIKDQPFQDELIKTALENSDFSLQDIKYRSAGYEDYLCSAKGFVHITVKMLSGRTSDQKRALSAALGKYLEQFFQKHKSQLSLTVEICDIERESYFKSGS